MIRDNRSLFVLLKLRIIHNIFNGLMMSGWIGAPRFTCRYEVMLLKVHDGY